jgi:SWI/SNF-related matrix-associated actin-dependent regulator of chromatin subfamily A member 5
LLPDIFSSADQFDEWFNLEIDDEDAKKNMIEQLHKILRPFMLRRLKRDVAKGLPPKTETILMIGMSKMQKQLYKKLLLRDLDSIAGNNSGKNKTAILNIVMQLRKCCGHPYLFEGMENRTLDPLGEHLVENCGKLFMVDKLLKKLKERGSRVLIFTQMTRILDILEDYMVMRGYKVSNTSCQKNRKYLTVANLFVCCVQYCRIDGNTNYEDREFAIDDFNREGSERFCFILSTRAGGLGINLQTADTCILYDSDWNPQQDLQAQDRCHRLGQKKPVSIYRLVSENTVEEKIVERAQQKLKLDAMVVQQGRLKEKDKKISKDEMMAAVRFGADTVFRSEESTITDDDIDLILERGKAKTKELHEKISQAEKGDLLDFRLDGGVSAQTFEGIDYSDKELRNQLRLLAANSMGKRERRPPPTSYNPIMHPKKSMIVNNRRIKLPKNLRLPSMEDHHFYNRERLLELGRLEFETYATLREAGKVPPKAFIEKHRTLLPDELGQEKLDLLDEGFGHWTRSQYFHFIKACAKFGRDDIASIAADMDMPVEDIAPYGEAFWAYGPTELKDEWERVVANIDKGEKKIAKQKKLSSLLSDFVSTFDDARTEMVFANKGTTHFAQEQDRALLCSVNAQGYGTWDSVREAIRNDSRLKFQHTVQGMTTAMIGKRCDYRMRQMERELEAREKALKNKRPASFIAAQKSIDAIKAMETWETETRSRELRGEAAQPLEELDEEGAQILRERLAERDPCVARLREIEGQVSRCLNVAEETRQAILRGDQVRINASTIAKFFCSLISFLFVQYVNYSNITLKSGGPNANSEQETPIELENGEIEARINLAVLRVPECGQCRNCTDKSQTGKLCEKRLEERTNLFATEMNKIEIEFKADKKKGKKRKNDPSTTFHAPKKMKMAPGPKKKAPKLMKKANGQLKPRVTSQGNKRMAIPDELFSGFCRRIGAKGTGERMKLINHFAEDNPTVSVRQVTLRLGEITTKDLPGCIEPPEKKSGRAFMFYLRPRFYKHLSPDELPEGWEKYAEEDESKWQQEKANKKASSAKSEEKAESVTSDKMESASNVSPSVVEEDDDDGEETEDEGEPAVKRLKLEN